MRRVADPRLARKSSASARRVRKARTYPRLRTPSNISHGSALRSSISLARTIALRTSFFLRLGMLRLQIQGLVDGIVPRRALGFHSPKRGRQLHDACRPRAWRIVALENIAGAVAVNARRPADLPIVFRGAVPRGRPSVRQADSASAPGPEPRIRSDD